MTKQKAESRLQEASCLAGIILAVLLATGMAQAVQLWVPDSILGNIGDTIEVPVLISGQTGRDIISADITIGFREDVLTGTSSYRLGNAAGGWMVVVNPMSCSLLVAMASASPIGAGDTLLFLKVVVDAGDTSPVEFGRSRLNEGQVACTTRAGMFYGYATGLEEQKAIGQAQRLSIWPNPTTGPVRLAWSAPDARAVTIRDPVGRIVSELPCVGQRAIVWNRTDAYGRSVSHGVYFATLHLRDGTVTSTLILR